MLITSTQNPKIKQIVKLRDKKTRDETGLFLIEGYRELLRAYGAKQPIQELYICPSLFLGTNEPALINCLVQSGADLIECSIDAFHKISYRDRPDGLLAIAPQMPKSLEEMPLSPNPLLVVAEAIEKPGNLGTILRSSDAAGIDALIVCDRCTDIYNPNVVRASVGTLFTVPVIEAEGKKTLSWLKEKGIQICAATPSATLLYTDADFTKPTAIAMGTEQLGLSDLWMEEADCQVRIPMRGKADSLNVAMATTLLIYEAIRQRGHSL